MDYEKLPFIDKVAGTLALRFFLRKRQGGDAGLPGKPQQILVVKLWGIGNLLLAGRALKSLRQRYPQARISLLTTPECQPLYDGAVLYDDLIPFNCKGFVSLPSVLRQLISKLEARGFDLAVNLDGLSKLSAFIALRSGAAASVGFAAAEGAQPPYSIQVPFDQSKPVDRLFYDCALAAGGAQMPEGLVRPQVREQERAFVAEALAKLGLDRPLAKGGDKPPLLVGFNINAGDFSHERRWPVEKFSLLAQMVEELGGYRTVFFGAASEERYVARCVKLMGTPGVSLAGAISLRQYLAFIERLHLLVTNDSAPLHFARALGVPAVAVFGPTSPESSGIGADEPCLAVRGMPCQKLLPGGQKGDCVSLLAMRGAHCLGGRQCCRGIAYGEMDAAVRQALRNLSEKTA